MVFEVVSVKNNIAAARVFQHLCAVPQRSGPAGKRRTCGALFAQDILKHDLQSVRKTKQIMPRWNLGALGDDAEQPGWVPAQAPWPV
jgi:hypothetical protein